MMKAGTDWRRASWQYSRERFNNKSVNLMKDGSLRLDDGLTGQSVIVWGYKVETILSFCLSSDWMGFAYWGLVDFIAKGLRLGLLF